MAEQRVSMTEAEKLLDTFFAEHGEHKEADAWSPKLGEIQTWCGECREAHTYTVADHREAVVRMMKKGAVGF